MARESRIAACVADPYVADSDAILSVFRRPDVAAVSQGPQTVPGQAGQTARFYGGEPGRRYPRLVAEPQKIECPLLDGASRAFVDGERRPIGAYKEDVRRAERR